MYRKRRRAYLAKALTSDTGDIDPLERGKLDRKNAVIVLPGETRELIWTFVTTDGFEFASNIAGHYREGMKGGFETGPVAAAETDPAQSEAPDQDAPADVASKTPEAKAAEETPEPKAAEGEPEVAEKTPEPEATEKTPEPEATEETTPEPKAAEKKVPEPKAAAESEPAETAEEIMYSSVEQHVRVSKLRTKWLKQKQSASKQKGRRLKVRTNFNSADNGNLLRDNRRLGNPDKGARRTAAKRTSSRADDKTPKRSGTARRNFASVETESYNLLGPEDRTFGSGPRKVARHDLTSTEFYAFSGRAAASGYRPVFVDGELTADGVRFSGVWERRDKGRWISRHGLTSGEYQALFDKFTGEGYRLVHVSGYWDGEQERYIAVWNR